MKIRPERTELFHADGRKNGRNEDGRMDRNDEVNSPFSQFCERA